jgi:hypothetical protein
MATLFELPWKSFTVQGFRGEVDIQGKPAVTFAAQIPLKKEAIQIVIAGDRGSEDEVARTLREIVANTDGESNWLTDGERSYRLGYGLGRLLGVLAIVGLVIWLIRKARS